MSAIGYAVLPTTISMKGISAQLSREFVGPATKASAEAARRMSADMAKGASDASAAVKKANAEVEKSTAAVADAQDKVKLKMSEREIAARNVETAELKAALASQDAAAKTAAAQAKAEDAVRKYGAGSAEAVKAEADLATARDKAQIAANSAATAVESARNRETRAASAVVDAEANLAQAKDKVEEATENVTAAQKRYDDALDGSSSAVVEMSDELRDMRGEMDAAADGAKTFGERLQSGLMEIGRGALLGIGAKIGMSVMDGVTDAVSGGWQAALDIDTGTRVLEGLYGSADEAQAMLSSLRDVAADSAIDYSSYLSASQALAYTGVEGERAITIMENVGLAALASGKDGDAAFETMNNALGKMVNEGRVGMESLSQLSGAGVPILSGLAEHFGVSMEEVNKMASKGAIDFEDVLSVMENATGSYFENALIAGEQASGSLENQLARVKDSITTEVGMALAPILAEMDFEAIGSTIGDLAANLLPVLGTAFAGLVDHVTTAVDLFSALSGWVQDNREWLEPLAVAIGAAAAAWAVWTGAIGLWRGVVTAATGIQTAFNAVMAANPIMLTVMAIAALVAGLTYFFTRTETGKEVWQTLVDAFTTGWEWVKGAFAAAWDFIQPVLQGLGDFFSWVGEIIGNVFSWIIDNWQLVVSAVFGPMGLIISQVITHWDTLKGAMEIVWQAVTGAITWAWEGVIQPVLGLISAAFSLWWEGIRIILGALGDFFVWVWEGLIKPAWDALGAGIDFVWQNIIRPAWDGMKITLQALGDFFSWVWNSIIKPAWDGLGNGIRTVIDNIVVPAWDRMKGALDTVKGRFEAVVGAIKNVWGSLTDALKKPVAFLINTVWNEKLVPAWNKVGGPDGFLPGLPAAQTLPGFRQGGAVFGPGTSTSDSILARLSDNEHVLTAADVDALGGHGVVYALREMARQGRAFTFDGSSIVGLPNRTDNTAGDLAGAAPGLLLPGFKDGGAVLRPAWMDQLEAGHRYAMTVAPAPYVLGGSSGGRPGGGTDCSGFMGEIADAITGGPVGTRSWATMTFPDRQAGIWQPGLGPGFSVGIAHGGMYGGHTAGTLTGVGPFSTTNVESGGSGPPSGAKYGGLAVGADHPQFTEHHHLRIGADGAFEAGGSGPSPEQQRTGLRTVVQDLFDKALDPVKAVIARTIGTPPPELLGTPAVGLDVTKTAAVDEAFDFIEKIGDGLRSAWNLARNFTGGLLRDNGGFIPPGLSVVRNETGVPEPVLTAGQWRGIHGLVDALHLLTPEMQDWVANGLDELERIANATEDGFREWSQATEEQGRMGHAGEFAAHYGNELAAELADGALGLIGLDGIIGSSWSPALADFVEELGLAMPALAPAPILDDSGRVIGTQLARAEDAMSAASTEVGETAQATAESRESGGGTTTVTLQGDAFTAAQVKEMLDQLDNVEAKVDDLAEGERASIDTTRKVLA